MCFSQVHRFPQGKNFLKHLRDNLHPQPAAGLNCVNLIVFESMVTALSCLPFRRSRICEKRVRELHAPRDVRLLSSETLAQ